MTREQINRLEMAQATNAYLDANAAVWSAIPIISNYKTTLIQAIQGIQEASLKQESSQVFISASLRELKQQIAQKMDILDDILEAYAADTENAELLSKSSNSASDYFRLANEDFEIKTKNVIDLLDGHVAEMADYGMSADQIEEVKTSFAIFQDKRGVPRSYQIQSRMATEDLAALFDEVNKTLARLDNVLKRFKRSNPAFYVGYDAARHIVKN
ncbi:hypothetical protein SAMN04488029_1104 [Reichenbachiella faecimaris]|uniref:Uncharacterized protein n=1 Tax=Reichenbachiella faecimaris TaxID=692418 RepID=A0A1W2G7Y4_REIFA|nr:hypothetical protein [Reichenbachiella faecimaris]SMD32753.1 hypothetical protein SAMN04488029_1104 [Reichenbachiella faecimaris]